MGQCECLPKCPFFHDKMENMPAMSAMLKHHYCLGDWAKCARHHVFEALGRGSVPADLYPNETDKARTLLEQPPG